MEDPKIEELVPLSQQEIETLTSIPSQKIDVSKYQKIIESSIACGILAAVFVLLVFLSRLLKKKKDFFVLLFKYIKSNIQTILLFLIALSLLKMAFFR